MIHPLVTLTTDFGTRDYYAAAVRGAILQECPNAVIMDITHDLEPFNLRGGSLILWQAIPCFPKGTIHAVIVFPETGVERVLAIKAGGNFLVGPDNGILTMAAEALGIEEVRCVERSAYAADGARTFDGRFLIAPAAGRLASGSPFEDLGPEVADFKRISLFRVVVGPNSVRGDIIHVDRFGNLVTSILAHNLPSEWGENLILKAGRSEWSIKRVACYAEGLPGEFMLIEGSVGLVEISLNRANASTFLRLKIGDEVTISRLRSP